MKTTTGHLSELVDGILGTHHAFLKSELPRLDVMLAQLEAAGAPAQVAAIAPVLHALHEELDAHLMKEEMVLFPYIRAIEAGEEGPSHCGSVRNPIRVMMMEHDSAAAALEQLRRITAGYAAPVGASAELASFYAGLARLDADLVEHMRVENDVLFPGAIALG